MPPSAFQQGPTSFFTFLPASHLRVDDPSSAIYHEFVESGVLDKREMALESTDKKDGGGVAGERGGRQGEGRGKRTEGRQGWGRVGEKFCEDECVAVGKGKGAGGKGKNGGKDGDKGGKGNKGGKKEIQKDKDFEKAKKKFEELMRNNFIVICSCPRGGVQGGTPVATFPATGAFGHF